ncbi:MAG: hypothetical protein WC816_04650 [Sphingomonas sp.]
MRILALFAAAAAATLTLSVPAAAQEHVVTRSTSSVHTEVRHATQVRHGPGWRPHKVRRVCRWQWRHHHRVRVCRTVRY